MPVSSCYVCIIYMGTPGIQFTARVGFHHFWREMERVMWAMSALNVFF